MDDLCNSSPCNNIATIDMTKRCVYPSHTNNLRGQICKSVGLSLEPVLPHAYAEFAAFGFLREY